MTDVNSALQKGSKLMVTGALIFLAYAVVFFFLSFSGTGFEIGVPTLNGTTPADLNTLNPAIMAYIAHLHIATSGFIASTSIAVMALCWYGVQAGKWWAWWAAMISPVVALIVALPMHYIDVFDHNWVTHIGPIYIGTAIFVIGGLMSGRELLKSA
jgi:hypothetical protein